MTGKKSVIIIGSATIDTIVQNNRQKTKIGGVVGYAGLAFTKQNIDTTVITNIADSDQAVSDFFRFNHIHLFKGNTANTTCFINVILGEQRHQKVPVAASSIKILPVADVIKKSNHLHLGPLFPTDIEPQQLAMLADYQGYISLDMQGLVRTIRNGIVYPKVSRYLPLYFKLAHSIKATGDEMDLILDHFHITLTQLQQKYTMKEILVTSGKQGGYLITAQGEKIKYQAYPASGIKDNTGSGDIFYAVYLAHRLHNRKKVQTALTLAAKTTAAYLQQGLMPML